MKNSANETDIEPGLLGAARDPQQIQAVVDRFPLMIVLYKPDTQVVVLNREFKRLTGWTMEDAAGSGLMERCYPDPAQRERARLFMDSCGPGWMDIRLTTKNGREIETSWANVRLENGLRLGMGIDITARVRAEDVLRASEQRFARFMQHLPGLAWIKNLEGRYAYVNDAAEAAFGHTKKELYGRTDEEIFPPETAAQFRENDRLALEAESGGRMTIETLEEPDGTHYSMVNKFPIPGPDGRVAWIGGMAFDVTEMRHAERALAESEARLRDADRRKDEFLATLAHELRNPMAPIRNAVHVLRLQGAKEPQAEEVLDMMERQVEHMVRLVDDLLEVSRITLGKIELRRQRVELDHVIQSAVEASRPAIEEAGHGIEVRLPAEAVALHGDPVRLAQIVGNLLHNASKYTEPGGRIALEARLEAGGLVIAVRDNGVGIALDMLPHVFEMFTQVDRSHGQSQGGLGIGLTLAQSLAHMHGGSVEAKSEGLGKGSEFLIHLPVHEVGERPMAASRERRLAAAPGGGLRVLVTDDVPDSADSMGMLLRLWGHDVRVTYGGEEALAQATSVRPDVVLLDLDLPDLPGLEVARHLRAHPDTRDIYLVALTGYGQREDRRRTHEAGFDAHLVKPVDPKELKELLVAVSRNLSS
ncbi:MAG TPA: PAS domain S-box protein [Candidatus Eisenbacteria bacterium]|nr:PAS domain S-box protein [Candidatus Eisenbacteria bacterium]